MSIHPLDMQQKCALDIQMSICPLDEQKRPLDIQMSICPLDKQKCPVDIKMSIGHFAEVLDINLIFQLYGLISSEVKRLPIASLYQNSPYSRSQHKHEQNFKYAACDL